MPRLPGVMFPHRLRRYRKTGETGRAGTLWEAQPTVIRAQVRPGKKLAAAAGGADLSVSATEASIVVTSMDRLDVDEGLGWQDAIYRVVEVGQGQAMLTARGKTWWSAVAVREQQ